MNVSEALIREIVTKVLEESAGKGSKPEFEKHIDPSGIIGGDAGGGPPHGLRHHGAGSHQLRVDPHL